MSEAIRTTLEEALSANTDLVIIRETYEGIGGSSLGLEQRFGEQVHTLPIADRAAVGTAIGMAIAGKTVIVELSSTGRLTAVAEALTEAASIHHNSEFRLGLILRVPYGGQAGSHVDRAVGDLLAAIPGLQVVCPATIHNASGLLKSAIAAHKPIVILEPRELYHRRGAVNPEKMTLDASIVCRPGHHVTIATWGSAVKLSLDSAEQLSRQGLEVEVIDLVSLSPVDRDCLTSSLQRTGRRRILQVGLDEAFLYLESPLRHAAANHKAVSDAVLQTYNY
jgi:pyruvate dehydrogenase E1 component beta subunit